MYFEQFPKCRDTVEPVQHEKLDISHLEKIFRVQMRKIEWSCSKTQVSKSFKRKSSE